MESHDVTILAKAHNGKVAVNTEIAVSGSDNDYVVTIHITPQTLTPMQLLDQLYGMLANNPMPEIDEDPLPEKRDDFMDAL
jgi:hypothetical protein